MHAAERAGAVPDERALPSATVLVIAYRMRATIGEAIVSALAQTVPCEIIVSDDSSGDGTLEAAQAAVAGYDGPHRVSVRSTARNLGLCAHLAELAQLATGEVLVFQAGDDVAYPHRVQRLLEAHARHPQAQVVGSHVDDVDAQGRMLAPRVRGTPARIDQRWLLHRGKLAAVLGASMSVRRTLFTRFPPLQGRVEDNMLTLRAVLAGECHCLPDALLAYRRHEHNLGDWVFDRSEAGYAGWQRRQRRVLAMYREIAADQRRCVEARPDLPAARRELGLALAALYELEAEQREALVERPRLQWIAPLWRGLNMRGLRRKSAERALKILLPRRLFGRN
jgi:glycosyltransferase involved in cell wall biosynthesis